MFKVHTIKQGWKATGLVPFNSSVVLNKLHEFESTPIESEGSVSTDSETWYTSSTIHQFNQYKWKLEVLEEDDNYDTDYIYIELQKLYKGSIAMINTVTLLVQSEDLIKQEARDLIVPSNSPSFNPTSLHLLSLYHAHELYHSAAMVVPSGIQD
ncbi:hypothetical protein PABG_11444 [Paracoccidioides brasiliensis Pb03]|nr:hypothetical protein PABG_11444 [Paracoccidioides brasiliensis Pb03]